MDRISVERDESGAATLHRGVPPESGGDLAGPADRTHAIAVATLDDHGQEIGRSRVELGATPVTLTLDPELIVVPDAGNETWAKIRLSEHDWTALADRLSAVSDPATRVMAYTSLRDQVRDAELEPGGALDVLTHQLPGEPDGVIVNHLLAFARESLAGTFSPAQASAERAERVSALADEILAAAEPGSDRQLIAFRAAVASARRVESLEAWLDGRALPDDLDLDPELRWGLVTRICVLADRPDLIDRSLKDDPSASGRVHAARARASLPNAAAKQQAWQIVMDPSTLSAYELYATARGFFHPEQDELTDGYVSRYFDEIGSTAGVPERLVAGRSGNLCLPPVRYRPDHPRTGRTDSDQVDGPWADPFHHRRDRQATPGGRLDRALRRPGRPMLTRGFVASWLVSREQPRDSTAPGS